MKCFDTAIHHFRKPCHFFDRKRFGNRVLKGIEIGYIASEKDRIIDYLADKDYDLKLLSVHHNGQFDYLDDEVKDMDPAIVIPQYFAQLSEALVVVEADVFAHFDYGFRVFGLSVAEFKQYEAQFLPILVAISITTIMNG